MGSKTKFEFTHNFSIPPEFPEVLKCFSREVLRIQPSNIEDFAVKYFERCIASREELEFQPAGDSQLSLTKIEELVNDLFVEYDQDGSGYLDPKEFKNLMNDFSERVQMPKDEIYRFLAEADMNEDGKIQWSEFVPIALTIIQALHAQKKLYAQQDKMAQAAEDFLVHGMSREELTLVMTDIFHRIDNNGSGSISKEEFMQGLTSMEIGLTRREINAIMMQVDANDDGDISYAEFVPFCFDLLHKMTAMQLLENEMEKDELAQFLMDLFRAKDVEQTGLINFDDIKDLLHQAMLGLSRIQIYAVIAESEPNSDGFVSYREFVPKAAVIVKSILSFKTNPQDSLGELDMQLSGIFDSLGAECTLADFEAALRKSGLFNEREISALINLGSAGRSKAAMLEANAGVDMVQVKSHAFRLMKHLRNSHFA